jgi:prepilin-type N-terminal cleavage/methylation domain-containing protein
MRIFRNSAGLRGLTLIEVLVASAILAFGMVALMGLVFVGTRAHRRAVDETVAVQIGQSVLADVRSYFETPDREPDEFFRWWAEELKKPPTPHPDYPAYSYTVRVTELGPPRRKGDLSPGREALIEVMVLWTTVEGKNGPLPAEKVWANAPEGRFVVFPSIMMLRTDR